MKAITLHFTSLSRHDSFFFHQVLLKQWKNKYGKGYMFRKVMFKAIMKLDKEERGFFFNNNSFQNTFFL